MTTVAAAWTGHDTRLVAATLLAIAVVVVLITKAKLHALLALILGSGTLGLVAGMPVGTLIDSFTTGVGDTIADIGVLIALGSMLGKLLADSGGAEQIVNTIVSRAGRRTLPWAMALVAALIGLPMFFEIGLVLLVPVILLVTKRSGQPLLLLGIPALAGLSVLHGLVPPHPGPLAAAGQLNANIGITLALGLLIAIPTVVVAGPLLAKLTTRLVPHARPPEHLVPESADVGSAVTASGQGGDQEQGQGQTNERAGQPSFPATLATVLLPVVLMLGKALSDILLSEGNTARSVLDFIGDPLVALLAAVLLGLFTLGRPAGFDRGKLSDTLSASLPPIASVLLIVGAGGGFKETLVDAGVGDVITGLASGANFSPLLLGWLVAVAIRLATGSATVATVSAAGIVAPLAAGLDPTHSALLVLAIGAGSLFFSHVNDAGFWLVKEFFGLSVGETIKSWSVMETVISVVAIVLILPLGALL